MCVVLICLIAFSAGFYYTEILHQPQHKALTYPLFSCARSHKRKRGRFTCRCNVS